MITPRATRLVRVADVQAFREAVVTLACAGAPLDARDRLVIVPTRAAAAHLLRSIEDRVLSAPGAVLLPDLITARELVERLGERLDAPRAVLTGAEREAILSVACRAARDAGYEPPFRLRPGLIAEILRFYDALRLRRNSVDDFERRALSILEPGASSDRGAERLVRQTRFLAEAFREFERRSAEHGSDEHERRERLVSTAARRPYRHLVLTVTDATLDPHGLFPADWDLLTRVPGLERLDVLVTDTMLAGALHERIHQMLPGIEEIRFEPAISSRLPTLLIPSSVGSETAGPHGPAPRVHRARDREEEVASFARRVKAAVRDGSLSSSSRAALVVRQPLPYVYVARDVLRSAGIACQMFDALPLGAEPYAAALDLVFSCVSANFAREPAVALLKSPHFDFASEAPVRLKPDTTYSSYADDVPALDRALAEAGYLGDVEGLERLLDTWRAAAPTRGRIERAIRAGELLLAVMRELLPLRTPGPTSEHLACLFTFLTTHERLPRPSGGSIEQDPPYERKEQDPPYDPDHALRARHLRARSAILGTIGALRDAWARFDLTPVDSDAVAALVRRWIEGQTFAPRAGESGVHLVDASSARFGDFEHVHLAGLVDGEWPDAPRRNIFYSASILRELGWPAESDRLAGARAAFADLLRLPSSRLTVSVFTLEADALVSPSPLVDEIEQAGLETIEESSSLARIFDYEALCLEPADATPLSELAREWAVRRWRRGPGIDDRFRGWTGAHTAQAYSLSALERYQDCPFKFFASDVLRLEEVPEDESTLSPRARGRFIHEVFQRFFESWDARGLGAITAERLDEARALMIDVAEPLLARLPDADAALERARLFGSAISLGSVDVVFEREVSSPAEVRERWLEYRLEGDFALGSADGRRVPLKGVADRIDLLAGNRLRVIDYKSGSAPNPRRALQVPIYALSAQERLSARDDAPWTIDEAAYVAFTGKRSYIPIVKAGAAGDNEALASARARLFDLVDGIARGEFPPRPHDPIICTWCAFATVCRKDYVDSE
ncbi:MAG TPA: PD-(D/E)XK nuclease family protein [Vicinamibacterales bacterium]|nr:PD-(D/E)XK nuclease family protein [Vicinamibacterales bacterium]